MQFRNAKKGFMWVWTEKAERITKQRGINDTRKAGQAVSENYRQSVPASWVEKGYVEEKAIAETA